MTVLRKTHRDLTSPKINGVHCLHCALTPSQIYPMVQIKGKLRRANRIAYQRHHNVVLLQTEWVLHYCDNTRCVEPLHLFLGDPAINMADKVKKDRQAKGERIGCKGLTAADVLAIRADPRGSTTIGRQYGVWRHTIRDVKLGNTWKHIDG